MASSNETKDLQQYDQNQSATWSPHPGISCGISCEILAFTTYLFVLKTIYNYLCHHKALDVHLEEISNSLDKGEAMMVGMGVWFLTFGLFDAVKVAFRFVNQATGPISATLTNSCPSKLKEWDLLLSRLLHTLKQAWIPILSWMPFPVAGPFILWSHAFISVLNTPEDNSKTLMQWKVEMETLRQEMEEKRKTRKEWKIE